MSILNVPAEYPPGYIGNPYNALDIGVFFDMNWPDHSGVKAQGFPAYSSGLGRLGCNCSQMETDENGDTYCADPDPCSTTPASVNCPTGYAVENGVCTAYNCGPGYTYTAGGICTANSSIPLNTALTPAQAGLTAAQQAALISATGNSAVSLIRTAEGGPYTVAGTNLVYNPATGQLTTAAATNATATLTAGLSAITPYIPLILAAIAAVVILPSLLGGKK